jgi:hypothetical protein
VPGLLPTNNPPPHGCEVEAMVELVTVRLADLVNARIERWNPQVIYAVPVRQIAAVQVREETPLPMTLL